MYFVRLFDEGRIITAMSSTFTDSYINSARGKDGDCYLNASLNLRENSMKKLLNERTFSNFYFVPLPGLAKGFKYA